MEEKASPRCTAKAPQMRSLVEHLRAEVPEFRSKEALAYPLAGFLALIALAMFSGVRRGPQDLAEYAATLSQGQLRALGFRAAKARSLTVPEVWAYASGTLGGREAIRADIVFGLPPLLFWPWRKA